MPAKSLTLAHTCRHLTHLSHLTLWHLDVWLPALECIAPQLLQLDLFGCRLQTGGVATELFAACARLKDLDLRMAKIDREVSRVCLPSLTELHLRDFHLQLADAAERYGCLELFSRGCPECETLSLTFTLADDISVCKAFGKLESVELDLDPVELRSWDWPADPPRIVLPSTVTRLECQSMYACAYNDVEDHLDLYAVLGLAAGCISDGVSLHELTLAHCATYVWRSLADDSLLEPSVEDLDGFYMPMAKSLHGLRKLCLSSSPHCGQEVISQVVMHAPDLAYLEIGVQCPPAGEPLERSIACGCQCKVDGLLHRRPGRQQGWRHCHCVPGGQPWNSDPPCHQCVGAPAALH